MRVHAFALHIQFDVEFIFKQIKDSITARTNKLREMSPVFVAMFETRDMKENEHLGEICIKFVGKNIDEKNVVDTLAFLLSYELLANLVKKLERKCVVISMMALWKV